MEESEQYLAEQFKWMARARPVPLVRAASPAGQKYAFTIDQEKKPLKETYIG